MDGKQLWAGPLDEGSQLDVEVGDLAGEGLVAPRQATNSGADRDLGVGGVAGGAQPRAGGHEREPG